MKTLFQACSLAHRSDRRELGTCSCPLDSTPVDCCYAATTGLHCELENPIPAGSVFELLQFVRSVRNFRSFANPEDCRRRTSEYGTYTSILLLLISILVARLSKEEERERERALERGPEGMESRDPHHCVLWRACYQLLREVQCHFPPCLSFLDWTCPPQLSGVRSSTHRIARGRPPRRIHPMIHAISMLHACSKLQRHFAHIWRAAEQCRRRSRLASRKEHTYVLIMAGTRCATARHWHRARRHVCGPSC